MEAEALVASRNTVSADVRIDALDYLDKAIHPARHGDR